MAHRHLFVIPYWFTDVIAIVVPGTTYGAYASADLLWMYLFGALVVWGAVSVGVVRRKAVFNGLRASRTP